MDDNSVINMQDIEARLWKEDYFWINENIDSNELTDGIFKDVSNFIRESLRRKYINEGDELTAKYNNGSMGETQRISVRVPDTIHDFLKKKVDSKDIPSKSAGIREAVSDLIEYYKEELE